MSAKVRSVIVEVAGMPITFTDFASLEQQASIHTDAIHSIERNCIAANPSDSIAWGRIERHATDLGAVLSAMEFWIAAEDAEIEREIEAARVALGQI